MLSSCSVCPNVFVLSLKAHHLHSVLFVEASMFCFFNMMEYIVSWAECFQVS